MPPNDEDDLLDLSEPPNPGRTPMSTGKQQRSALGIAASLAPGISAKRDASAAADALSTPQYHEPRRSSAIRPSHSTFRDSARRSSRRVSRASRFGGYDGEEDERKLPTLVPGIRPAYSTPLPVLPMIVLCIAMLSELLSANLSQPFMLKMVESFFLKEGRPHGSELEAAVGLWTGNLVSVFYITQFFTSLLWSSIADRHGRRAVLVASMTGSGIALLMFGTSQSLPEAICVRLIQGIFGGAIGVFRGSIRDLTDDTNATRAYAVLGFSWGLGGVVGPIIGGLFENPHLNHPDTVLGRIPVFERLPYFLPTLMGGVIMFVGAILSCFLSWDGGVRGGQRIQLELEKDEPLVPARADDVSPVPTRVAPSSALRINKPNNNLSSAQPVDSTPSVYGHSTYGRSAYGQSLHPGGEQMGTSARMHHRESLASIGTAYGYGGIRSKHPTLAARRAIEAARRVSAAQGRPQPEHAEGGDRNVSLATRLLLANEDNTFNINDLWLSAAVAQDTAVFDDDDEYDEDSDNEERYADDSVLDFDDRSSLAPTDDGTPTNSATPSPSRSNMPRTRTASSRYPGSRRLTSGGSDFARFRRTSTTSRRYSNSSNHMPSIFSNTGVASTPGIQAYEETEPSSDLFSPTGTVRRIGAPTGLTAISEQHHSPGGTSTSSTLTERPQSRWKLLPLLVICQYGLLSCHDSTHGQLFLSFIVTPYQSGGVGISPASYSVFVAIMCVGQLIYQFYLFPRLGPPLGRFSHLQMFRLGSMLYVPGYLLVPLLHSFATPGKDGGFFVMTMMALISAIRYCGGTFAYTSIMILINAMTPPHLIGLANGLAQSTVSCARFFGPALGGALWSTSINGNPGGYASGFYTVAMFATAQVIGTFFIR